MLKHSEYSPILHEKDNVTLSTSGDQIYAYRLVLPEAFSLSEKQFEEIHSTWYRALKSLPRCIFIKQDYYVKRTFSGSEMPEETFLQKEAKKNAVGEGYISHICNIYFINAGTRYLKNGSIANPFRKPPSEKEIKNQIAIDQTFSDEIGQAVAFLKSSPFFSVAPLMPGYARSLAKLYFNGFYDDRITDTIRSGNGMSIGEKKVGTFAITSNRQLPESISTSTVDNKTSSGDFEFHKGLFDSFGLELPFDHMCTQVLYLDDHTELRNGIRKKQKSFNDVRQFAPENEQIGIELKNYLKEISGDEKIRLVRAHFNISFFAESNEEYKNYQSQITQRFKELDITPYFAVGNNQANIYNHSFFTYASGLNKDNAFVIDLQQALCLFTNVSTFRQDKEGVFFNDRIFSLPLRKDIWDVKKKYVKARNFFVVAPTGEGKSVLANTILSQLLEQGYYILINDLGGSYEKMALLYPDITLYLQYTPGDPIGINPFYIPKGSTPDLEKLNELVEFIRTVYRRDDPMEEKERVSIRKILQLYYQTVGEGHSLPNFYYFVEYLHKNKALKTDLEINEDQFDARNFLHICSEFVGEGSYAFLFPEDLQESNIDLEGKRLVILEFDKAQNDPLLVSILLNLSNAIDRKLIWEDKMKRGFIFYDECAKQFKFPNVLTTVEYKFQAIRKQEAGIGIVLQSPNQLPRNSSAESIIDNTQMYFILNNVQGYNDIVERFRFSTHEHNMLKSITNNFSADAEKKYSEFMFRRARHSNILRLHLAEAVRCAYLTEGAEHLKIMGLHEKHQDMSIAIQKYMTINEGRS